MGSIGYNRSDLVGHLGKIGSSNSHWDAAIPSEHRSSILGEERMIKFRYFLGAGAALALVGIVMAGLAANDARSQTMKECCDDAAVNYSKDLWSTMEKAGLAGKGAKDDKPYNGRAPHGAVLETIHSEVIVGSYFFGLFGGHEGKVVVKRNYGGEGVSIDAVNGDRAKFLKAVTVMFKRETGYDKDNNDWFWVKYKPDGSLHTNPKGMKLAGRVMKGADKGCIACHLLVKDKDYLFGKLE
jgi:hypothetical protein